MRNPSDLLCLIALVFASGCSESRDLAPVQSFTAPAEWLAELPVTPGVEITAKLEKPEYELGEPIEIPVTYRNVGNGPDAEYWVTEDNITDFIPHFFVTDSAGSVLKNPYSEPLRGVIEGAVFISRKLGPGKQITIRETLNECVCFDRPGTYSVTPFGVVYARTKRSSGRNQFRGSVKPTSITIRAFDKNKRAGDIQKLVSAYRSGKPEWDRLPFREFFHPGAERDRIVVVLAFLRSPDQIPFFREVLEEKETYVTGAKTYAQYALEAMPGRLAERGHDTDWTPEQYARVERSRSCDLYVEAPLKPHVRE